MITDLHHCALLWSPKRLIFSPVGDVLMQKIKCLCGLLVLGLCSTCTDWRIHHVMLRWRKSLFCVCIGLSFRYLMRSSLHKSEKCYLRVWGKLNSQHKRVYTTSGESMKNRFVSEQFRVRAKNCESYGLWSFREKQSCVLCLRCMLGLCQPPNYTNTF